MDLKHIDLDKVCRVCLKHDPDAIHIFEENNAINSVSIGNMLSECTMYKVQRHDEFPHLICIECKDNAKIAFDFKKQCERSYRTLVDILERNKPIDYLFFKNEQVANEKATQTDETMVHPCEKCDEKFHSYEELRDHRFQKHKNSPNECRFCKKSFNRIGHLKSHIEVHHPEVGITARHVCKVCDKQFTRKEHLQRHLLRVHKIDVKTEKQGFNCGNCQMTFKDEAEFGNHNCEPNISQEVVAEKEEPIMDIPPIEAPIQIKVEDTRTENLSLLEPEIFMDNSYGEEFNAIEMPKHEIATNEDRAAFDGLMSMLTHHNNDDSDSSESESDNDNDEDYKAEEDDEDDLLIEIKKEKDGKSPSGNVSPTKTSKQPKEKKEFKCDECDKIFTRSHHLKRHKILHTGGKVTERSPRQLQQENKCTECNKTFSRGAHLKRHMATHLLEKPFACEICLKPFSRKDHMQKHMLSHSTERPFACDMCDKAFSREDHLRTHKTNRHSGKVPLERSEKCAICGKGFTTTKSLISHLRLHEEKAWQCKFCEAKFATGIELKDHTKAHENAKPFLCSECGLRFPRNDYLVIHMRRHTGEKPFKCKFCDKGFPRSTDLKVHEKYHTGDRSHLCIICGKGFHRHYNLVIHMRIHTGEKPYTCEHCGKGFAQRNDMKAHVRRHTGERFKCDICGEGFVQGYTLTNHKRTAHGIDVQSNIGRLEKFPHLGLQAQHIMQGMYSSTSGNMINESDEMTQNEPVIMEIEVEPRPEHLVKVEHSSNHGLNVHGASSSL